MALRIFGSETASIFCLLGKDENSATSALGWVIEKSPAFRALLISDILESRWNNDGEVAVDLQRHDKFGGFTDIELTCKDAFHFIIEAKQGWLIPGLDQLEKYADRLRYPSKIQRRMLTLSAATKEYTQGRLPKQVSDIPLIHRSWADLLRITITAQQHTNSHEEKLWLRQFARHLEDYVSMRNPRDNFVYVVSLSTKPIKDGNSYSWTDVVEKDRRYFHPIGNTWPTLPPNYVAFRYRGTLQTVHHIENYEIVTNPSLRNANWIDSDVDHFVYTLGSPMRPAHAVRTGNIYRNGRVWCAIDTLLSGICNTISDARDETLRRLKLSETDAPNRYSEISL